MRLYEVIKMAMRTVTSSPMRTILTMLGVIIGVSSVITLVSIGRGSAAAIEKQYENLGSNLLTVNVMGRGRATQLDYDELMQLEELPEFGLMAPAVSKNSTNVKVGTTSEEFNITGTNDRYLSMVKAEVNQGRFLAPADLDFRSKVAVLGSGVVETLFGNTNPIGQEINVAGYVYTVIGTLKEQGSSIGSTSVDDVIFVPLPTLQRDFKLGAITTTYIEAASENDIAKAQETIETYLAYKFKSEDGFRVNNQEQLMESRQAAAATMTNQLIAVACISLLVGGIGIMNIMLVTVSERTREIGIRKSIGAKRRTILLQFLVESTVLSGLGGLIGLILGVIISLVWPLINPSQTTQLSLDVGIYAFVFSALVGIIFGLYPANKASKLKPIDALRTD